MKCQVINYSYGFLKRPILTDFFHMHSQCHFRILGYCTMIGSNGCEFLTLMYVRHIIIPKL